MTKTRKNLKLSDEEVIERYDISNNFYIEIKNLHGVKFEEPVYLFVDLGNQSAFVTDEIHEDYAIYRFTKTMQRIIEAYQIVIQKSSLIYLMGLVGFPSEFYVDIESEDQDTRYFCDLEKSIAYPVDEAKPDLEIFDYDKNIEYILDLFKIEFKDSKPMSVLEKAHIAYEIGVNLARVFASV